MGAPDALAFEAVAALESYEARFLRICGTGADPAVMELAASDLCRLRSCCAPLPQLSAPCLDLVLSHQRLVDCEAPAACGSVPACDQLHLHKVCIEALRRHCRQILLAPHRR